VTVVHLGNQRYEGLTADSKPTNVPAGAIFRDTQTDIYYEYNGSSWDIIIGNTKTETLTNKTITDPLFDNFYDMGRISAPSDPSSNQGRFYVKQVDSNNDGVFVKLKRNGSFVETRIV
jgi:hypothetical protein